VSGIFNIKRRLLIGGSVLIILGLVLYVVKGVEAVLVLPIIGIILLIVGALYKPRQRR